VSLAGALTMAVVLAVAQAAPAAAQTAPSSTSSSTPSLESCPRPVYPREAVRYELEGVSTLRFVLSPNGRVAAVQVAKSSGWAMLDQAVVSSIQACRFTPEQAAKAKGAALPVAYVWSLDGEHVIRPHLMPGSCPASGRFLSFQPYDNKPSGPDGVKVRLLVDPAGQPRGVKLEGAALPPAMADALVKYVESCRFGFDPAVKGERTDTVYGRVVLK
jgi:TonB family protein